MSTAKTEILSPEEKILAAPEHVENISPDLMVPEYKRPTEYEDAQLKSNFDRLAIWEAVKVFRKTVLICFIAGFTAATDGYQYQMSGSIVANKGLIRTFSHGGAKLDPKWVSTFNGIFSAGQVIGQFSMQWVSEWIGRRGAIFTTMGLLTIAAIVEAVSKEWYVWTAAKLIAGIGIGAVQATLPVYINEHAPVQMRGFLVVAYSLWFNIGSLLASIVLKVRADASPFDFRTSVYTQFAMIGISVIIFIFLPESPWWLVRKGKMDKARRVLQSGYGNVPNFDVDQELGILAYTIEKQRQWDEEAKAQGPFAIFKGLNGKRFLIGSWPKVLQQFVGLAVFSSNASYFFQIAGNNDPFQVTIIIGCTGLIAVILDSLLIDKIGRRNMTLIGFSGACFGVTLIAIIGCLDYTKQSLGAVLVFGGVVANFFNTFQSSTSYAYITEMSEQRIKARAAGWGLAYCNLYAVLINFTLPLMLARWSVRAAWFFVCTGVPGTILAFFIMPESMRRSPAEIQEMFVDHVPLRKWKGYKTAVERDLDARVENNQF